MLRFFRRWVSFFVFSFFLNFLFYNPNLIFMILIFGLILFIQR